MTKLITATCFAVVLFCCGAVADAQVSVGIRIGAPPRARVERVLPQPGPAYVWVPGYWYPAGNRYAWHRGYWTLPPYAGAQWIAPRYEGNEFYNGYWQGARGQFEHNHKWDREKNRDGDRDRDDRDRDHDRDRH